jgi:glycosyltransferase involved in cell wall biosynthesis
MPNISVIICCYNSASKIKPTLEHINRQELSGLTCELIVINNNCTDNTIDIVKTVWRSCSNPFQLKIVDENKPGLSNARKAGVLSAFGEVIVFCDDDNWLNEYYLYNVYNILKANSNVGLVGGVSKLASNVDIPNWFTTYQSSYAVGVQGLNSGIINKRGYLWGAGLSFRRLEMIKIYKSGFSNLLSDRSSNGQFLSGGDSEICKWFLLIGKDLFYDENLIFYHFIDEKRFTKDYFNDLIKSINKSMILIKEYDIIINVIRLNALKRKFNKIRVLFYFLRNCRYNELKIYFHFLTFNLFNINSFYKSVFKSLRFYMKTSDV